MLVFLSDPSLLSADASPTWYMAAMDGQSLLSLDPKKIVNLQKEGTTGVTLKAVI